MVIVVMFLSIRKINVGEIVLGRYILTALAIFLVICTSSQLLRADNSTFEETLFELCNGHYLFEDIILDPSGSNHSYIWLIAAAWKNPRDTKRLVTTIKMLAKQSTLNEYEISVFGKPSLTNRIALITIRPTGVTLDYTYTEAKQKSFALKKPSWEQVDVLKIRGRAIYNGLHADSVFEVLTKSDAIAAPDVNKDEDESLIVTHHWKVDDQFIDITFRRWDNMYRVRAIRVVYDKAATRPESCHIYEDCTMYGGCKNFSNCYGACVDDCVKSGCSLCK